MNAYLWDTNGEPAGSVVIEAGDSFPPRSTLTPPPDPISGHRVVWRNGWTQELIAEPSLEALKAHLIERTTALRWEKETGGIAINGAPVATTIADQNRIVSVLASPTLDQLGTVDFKGRNGWITLTVAELTGIAAAIANHVQACFSAERAHHEAIAALDSVEDALAYDPTAGWPTQGEQQ